MSQPQQAGILALGQPNPDIKRQGLRHDGGQKKGLGKKTPRARRNRGEASRSQENRDERRTVKII
jgi:hypothetical protein